MGGPGSHLVGREQETALITSALRGVSESRPAVVLVRGEAGIGKSAVVDHVAGLAVAGLALSGAAVAGDAVTGHAPAGGFRVVRGFCAPVGATVLPYGPIVGLVAELRKAAPGLVGSLSPEVQRGLWPLTGTSDIAVTDRNATRLFAGFVELLSAAGRERPLLVVVEDLHWADPASIDLLSYTVRTIRAPVALLLTERDTAADRRVTAELSRAPGAVSVRLGPLRDDDVRQLIADLDHPPGSERSAQISAMAGGIPFLAVHLATERAVDATPSTLLDVLSTSIEALPEPERRLLVLLAVIGRRSDDIYFRAAGMASTEFDTLCRALRQRNLISVQDDGIDFRHALIGESVLRTVMPGERRDAHTAAAEALLASGAGLDPAQSGSLSYHLHACGRHRDALPHTLRAARRAQAVWAFSDARATYSLLRTRWPTVDKPSEVTGVGWDEVLRESAAAALWSGDPGEALDLLRVAAELPDLSPAGSAATELAIGRALAAAGETNEALAAYGRALAALPADSPDVLRVTVSAALAQALMLAGRSQEALTVATEAWAAAASVGADRDRMHAVITAAAANAQLGDAETAISMLRDCLPQVQRLDDLELVLRCHSNLAFALGVLGRHEDCARAAADGLRACRRYGNVTSLVTNLRNNQVSALVTIGRWDQALSTATEALDQVSNPGVALYLRTRIAEVELARGHRPAADSELAAIAALGVEDPYAVAAVARLEAERALQDGDLHTASTAVTSALAALRDRDDAVPLLRTCWLGLRAVADLADLGGPRFPDPALRDARDQHLALARDAAVRSSLDAAAVLLATCEAEAARVTASDTAEQWQNAADGWQRHSEPHSRAYCLFRLAAERLRAQARTAAAVALDGSLRIAESLGAAPLEQEIRRLATVGDLPTEPPPVTEGPRSPSPDPLGLTVRERQVLELLATGATNRKVARTLNISERTAGVHVSNILNKLGVSNRTEAARIAMRRPDPARLDRYRR